MNKQVFMDIAQTLVAEVKADQSALLQRAICKRGVRCGEYSAAMEVTST